MKRFRQFLEDAVPANAMGGSSSHSGPIAIFDPILLRVKKKPEVLRRKPPGATSFQRSHLPGHG